MYDHVVVDVEIQNLVDNNPYGWDDTDKLGVAVACVWQYSDQRMRVYGPNDVEVLRNRLLCADRISGFNIFNFDFPVIWGVKKQEWLEKPSKHSCLKDILYSKTDDMLRRIWQAMNINPDIYTGAHKGTSLDEVAGATLCAKKIGHGADAPKWYQEGNIQKVVNYCSDDTCLERDLCDFIDKYGYVIVKGQKLMIPTWKGGV